MAWVYLVLAGVCEMIWPLGFKYTNGFSRNYWAITGTFAIMGISLYLMSLATKWGIPIGNAYAVWTGLGAAGTAILGMWVFGEPKDVARMICFGLIIAGVVGLKLVSPAETAGGPAADGTAVQQEAPR